MSESGLGAFVARELTVGELVTLEIPLEPSGKLTIPAKVARCLGTLYRQASFLMVSSFCAGLR